MKKVIIAAIVMLMLASCATTQKSLPFATTNRIGKYPVQKNKPIKNNSTWIFRQWGHEGR